MGYFNCNCNLKKLNERKRVWKTEGTEKPMHVHWFTSKIYWFLKSKGLHIYIFPIFQKCIYFQTAWHSGRSFWKLWNCISKSCGSISLNNSMKTFFFFFKTCLRPSSEAIPNLEVAVENPSQAADEKWGSKLLKFGSISTSCLRDFLIKEWTLGHFPLFFKCLKMSPLTSPSPVHFVVPERQLLKSRSSAGFPPGDRPFPFAHSTNAAETGER